MKLPLELVLPIMILAMALWWNMWDWIEKRCDKG